MLVGYLTNWRFVFLISSIQPVSGKIPRVGEYINIMNYEFSSSDESTTELPAPPLAPRNNHLRIREQPLIPVTWRRQS